MSSNSFGKLFTVTTFGESHGPAIGCVVDGCPPGLAIAAEDFRDDLERRATGKSRYTSQRREADEVEIISGVFEGRTTGTPIALLIRNTDARSKDYDDLVDKFRPGHADYTYLHKYGLRDHRGSGRASARETAMRVAAAVIAKKWLAEKYGVRVRGHLAQIGDIVPRAFDWEAVEANPFFWPDAAMVPELESYIMALRKSGDSVGARVTVVADGVPPGWGEPVYGKLDGDLAAALMSINAVKGVEIGAGFASVAQKGSDASRRDDARRFPLEQRRRHPRRHLERAAGRRVDRAEADVEHPDSGPHARSRRRAGRGRDQRPPRSLRRHSRDADRRSDGRAAC